MKRPVALAALLVAALLLSSCGLAKNTANTLGRTVQGVTRSVGL